MLKEKAGIKEASSEENAEKTCRKMDDILDELPHYDGSEMCDDGTFEYYGGRGEQIEEGVDSMLTEMFSNSDDPYEDADDYAEMMAERAADD